VEVPTADTKSYNFKQDEAIGTNGAKYLPLDTIIRWMSGKIKRNGRRIQRAVRQIVNDGYLILHKGGKTASLNPAKSREIVEFVRKFVK